jgi:hypothetical protein
MWRMTPRLATAALTATLALAALTAPEAQASSVQSFNYTSSGTISDSSGPAPISFQGVTTPGTLTTPGSFILGEFISMGTLPPSATLTYNNTPFTIDVLVNASPIGGSSNGSYYDYKLSGFLNGSITGAGWTNMMATVTTIGGSPSGPTVMPPFDVSELTVAFPQGITAPMNGNNGISLLTAQVLPAVPAPEPTSMAAFAVGLVGWGLRRRLRARA